MRIAKKYPINIKSDFKSLQVLVLIFQVPNIKTSLQKYQIKSEPRRKKLYYGTLLSHQFVIVKFISTITFSVIFIHHV